MKEAKLGNLDLYKVGNLRPIFFPLEPRYSETFRDIPTFRDLILLPGYT